MKRFATTSFACLSLSLLAGCGSATEGEEIENTEQHDEIKPTDQDKDRYGDLIIDQWSFSGLPKGEIIDPSNIVVTVAGKTTSNGTLNYGDALHLLEGEYPVRIATSHVGEESFTAKVTRKKKTHFTLPLAAVSVHFDDVSSGSPSLAAVDFGVIPTFKKFGAYAQAGALSPTGQLTGAFNVPFDTVAILFASSTVSYGWNDGSAAKTKALSQGKFTSINGPAAPATPKAPPIFDVNVSVPKRVLPNEFSQHHTFSCTGGGATAALPAATPTLHAFVQTTGTCAFTFVNAGSKGSEVTALTQSTTKAQSITVKRIDVNDVDVTPEAGGAKYKVKGTYKVVDAANSEVLVDNISTGSGIDVLPGKYYVEINYVVTGETKTQKFTLNL